MLSGITPCHKLVYTVDFMVGDLGEHPCQPCLRILAANGGGFHGAFYDIIVEPQKRERT